MHCLNPELRGRGGEGEKARGTGKGNAPTTAIPALPVSGRPLHQRGWLRGWGRRRGRVLPAPRRSFASTWLWR